MLPKLLQCVAFHVGILFAGAFLHLAVPFYKEKVQKRCELLALSPQQLFASLPSFCSCQPWFCPWFCPCFCPWLHRWPCPPSHCCNEWDGCDGWDGCCCQVCWPQLKSGHGGAKWGCRRKHGSALPIIHGCHRWGKAAAAAAEAPAAPAQSAMVGEKWKTCQVRCAYWASWQTPCHLCSCRSGDNICTHGRSTVRSPSTHHQGSKSIWPMWQSKAALSNLPTGSTEVQAPWTLSSLRPQVLSPEASFRNFPKTIQGSSKAQGKHALMKRISWA